MRDYPFILQIYGGFLFLICFHMLCNQSWWVWWSMIEGCWPQLQLFFCMIAYFNKIYTVYNIFLPWSIDRKRSQIIIENICSPFFLFYLVLSTGSLTKIYNKRRRLNLLITNSREYWMIYRRPGSARMCCSRRIGKCITNIFCKISSTLCFSSLHKFIFFLWQYMLLCEKLVLLGKSHKCWHLHLVKCESGRDACRYPNNLSQLTQNCWDWETPSQKGWDEFTPEYIGWAAPKNAGKTTPEKCWH